MAFRSYRASRITEQRKSLYIVQKQKKTMKKETRKRSNKTREKNIHGKKRREKNLCSSPSSIGKRHYILSFVRINFLGIIIFTCRRVCVNRIEDPIRNRDNKTENTVSQCYRASYISGVWWRANDITNQMHTMFIEHMNPSSNSFIDNWSGRALQTKRHKARAKNKHTEPKWKDCFAWTVAIRVKRWEYPKEKEEKLKINTATAGNGNTRIKLFFECFGICFLGVSRRIFVLVDPFFVFNSRCIHMNLPFIQILIILELCRELSVFGCWPDPEKQCSICILIAKRTVQVQNANI